MLLFTFRESKRQAHITKHGFDFAEFEDAFSFDRFLSVQTKPSLTGRERFKRLGSWRGETVAVVIVSPPGTEAIDIVSVRRANPTLETLTRRDAFRSKDDLSTRTSTPMTPVTMKKYVVRLSCYWQ